MVDINEIERIKSVIIEHVAKDVLMLTEKVETLNEQLDQVSNMLKMLEDNTEKQFDLTAKKIIDLLIEQEKYLADIADARTKQISLTVSDNVEKILNGKFENYQQVVDKALDKFKTANIAAVESLNSAYMDTENKIKTGHLPRYGESKSTKILTVLNLVLSAASVAGIISLVMALLI